MLAGCTQPHQGSIAISGFDMNKQPQQARRHIGYLPDIPPLYKELTVNQYLCFCAQLHQLGGTQLAQALEQTLSRCNLHQVSNQLIATLSKGYQQRVGIAQAIIHNPEVIILDEPTVGLDPGQIHEIRQLIRELGNQHSVLFSTHLLSEAETICDRIIIMRQGKIIYNDHREALQQYQQSHVLLVTLGNPPPLSQLSSLPGVTSVHTLSPQQFKLTHQESINPGTQLVKLASEHNWQLQQLTPVRITLEEIFQQLTDHTTTERHD